MSEELICMADEETQEPEVTEDVPATEADTSGPETEAAASDANASEAGTPSSPDEASDAATEDAPAKEAPAAPAGEAAEAAPAESPKQRKQRKRVSKLAPARGQTSPEERQAERDAERRRKAVARRSRRLRERERSRERRAGAATPEPLPSLRPEKTGQQKVRQGIVVSDRAAKTITVRIDVTRRHPRYEKVVRTSTTLHAHDEQDDAHIGDTVVITEARPLSRTKRWRLVEVVERAK
jgi:small subunit ribosomal protein S17